MKASIAALQNEQRDIEQNLARVREEKLPWRITLLRILRDARRDKGDATTVCCWFGKCENCWLQCGDGGDDDGFETTGCNVTKCLCICHRSTAPDLSSKDRQSARVVSDTITATLAALEQNTEKETDPIRYLTAKEAIETLGEFARGMFLVSTPYCGMICAKWVRFQCLWCVFVTFSAFFYSLTCSYNSLGHTA